MSALSIVGRQLGRNLWRQNGLRALSSTTSALGSPTHTGQDFDPEDVRNARFLRRPKEVNQQWAVNIIKEEPIVMTDLPTIGCDGGGGALGHPRVYINVERGGVEDCTYCGKRFQMKPHH
eukprot:maker-scaffold44_size478958-snap-gene-1.13 protein:Tk06919 transcript:maker-scaffold44_size478958-snap-gene-1.13-mRNA-1 annotation:"loc100127764 protein"